MDVKKMLDKIDFSKDFIATVKEQAESAAAEAARGVIRDQLDDLKHATCMIDELENAIGGDLISIVNRSTGFFLSPVPGPPHEKGVERKQIVVEFNGYRSNPGDVVLDNSKKYSMVLTIVESKQKKDGRP